MPWSRHCCVVWCIFCTLALDARTTPRMQPWFEPAHEGSRCTAKSLYSCPRVFAMHNKRSLSFPVSIHIILGSSQIKGHRKAVITLIGLVYTCNTYIPSLCVHTRSCAHCMAVVVAEREQVVGKRTMVLAVLAVPATYVLCTRSLLSMICMPCCC